jgi:hypothetical protein
MRVSITQGGTIVPVLTTTEVDSDDLEPKDAAALRKLVEKAGIGKAASPKGSAARPAAAAQPDRGSYRITIRDGAKRSSVSLVDADLGDAQELVDFVSGLSKAKRRTEPLGG